MKIKNLTYLVLLILICSSSMAEAAIKAPSNLVATAVSSSQINLTWMDNSLNEIGFQIWRSPDIAGQWMQIATVGANVNAYQDSGLKPSTLYFYRVIAFTKTDESTPSNIANATTLAASSTTVPKTSTTVPKTSTVPKTTTTISPDSDSDGIVDNEDNCPYKSNGYELGSCSPWSGSPGVVCQSDSDCSAGCTGINTCNKNQEDDDNDGVGDVCDNCPGSCNSLQKDADQDGRGDVCDSTPACGGCSGVQCEHECTLNLQIAVAGGLAVVTDEYSPDNMARLQVTDVTNSPFVLGELNTNIPVFYDVALNSTATMAVVAAGSAGIKVIDISQPQSPVVIGSYDTPGMAYGVSLNNYGTIAYVADGTAGLKILNLSNPRAPMLIGGLLTSGLWNDVELSGAIACMVNQQGSMETVDVSTPYNPVIKGTIGLNGAGHAIAVDNTKVAVLSQTTNDLLEIIDIVNPEQPVYEGYAAVTSKAGTAKGIDLTNGVAYIAAGSEGLKCYTIVSAPLLNYIVPVLGGAYDVSVNSIYAYVTGNPANVSIIELPY